MLVETTRRNLSGLVATTVRVPKSSSSRCRSSSAAMTVSRKGLQNNHAAWKAPHHRNARRLLSTSSDKQKKPLLSPAAHFVTAEQCAADLAQLASVNGTAAAEAATTTWSSQLAQYLSPSQRQQVHRLLESATEAAAATPGAVANAIPEPSVRDLRLISLTVSIPFVGFGIMDNAILIIAGDAIDTSLGVLLGISTMCAAAIGNIVSDVAGVMMGTVIEDWCALYLNLPQPNLTQAQRTLRSVRMAGQFGTGAGIVVGCIIGMFPLLFIDSNRIQVRKREKHLDSIFQDVVTEAKTLIGAQQTCLFLLVNNESDDEKKKKKKKGGSEKGGHIVPTPDGKYLYAKYGAASEKNTDRILPLGRGIVSRAALTAQAWNIPDVSKEPDFSSEMAADITLDDTKSKIRNMVCVPVLDPQGRTIAVIRAVNKVGKGRGDPDDALQRSYTSQTFTNDDVQILKALAGHISVSLQRMYEADGEKEELRLKDTIRILKEYGLEGIAADKRTAKRRPLFPEA
jgi:GAF domain-containing protein